MKFPNQRPVADRKFIMAENGVRLMQSMYKRSLKKIT